MVSNRPLTIIEYQGHVLENTLLEYGAINRYACIHSDSTPSAA